MHGIANPENRGFESLPLLQSIMGIVKWYQLCQELLTAHSKCSNIRQALLEVGLAAKGGNTKEQKN